MILRPFLIARCQTAKLLQPIDGPLDHIPQTIHRSIERSSSRLIALAWNRTAYSPLPQKLTNPSITIAFVSHNPLWIQPWSSSSRALDCSLAAQAARTPCFHVLRPVSAQTSAACRFHRHADGLWWRIPLGCVLKPQFLGPLFCPSGVLMSTNHCGIDMMNLPIEITCGMAKGFHFVIESVPCAIFDPSGIAIGDG